MCKDDHGNQFVRNFKPMHFEINLEFSEMREMRNLFGKTECLNTERCLFLLNVVDFV